MCLRLSSDAQPPLPLAPGAMNHNTGFYSFYSECVSVCVPMYCMIFLLLYVVAYMQV